MRRIATTLAVVGALLFSAGSAIADDTSEANKLFVEAVKLVKSAANAEESEEQVAVLEEALGKLNEIVDDYPSSDLAVKLISGQRIGGISLDLIAEAIKIIPLRAKRAAEEARKEAELAQKLAPLRTLAEQGDAQAQYDLGYKYIRAANLEWKGSKERRGLQARALIWFTKAAKQGHVKAQYKVGSIYYFGEGVPKNEEKARKWYREAAQQGDESAKKMLKSICPKAWEPFKPFCTY